MKQIVIVHGGSSFDSYENYLNNLKSSQLHYELLLYSLKWRDWLAQETVDADVLLPNFPNRQNANCGDNLAAASAESCDAAAAAGNAHCDSAPNTTSR